VDAAGAFDARRTLYDALKAWLRALPSAVLGEAVAQWQTWSGTAAAARDGHRTLRVGELQALACSPLIEIGSHSVSHPVLGLLDAEAQREECTASCEALAHWLGRAPALFAYPFGDGAAVTRGAESAVRAAGYDAAFTTSAQSAWRHNRATAVPRIAMQAWDGAEFARRLPLWFDE
jgi:peptidoglycan/xylan/chitin deacetylase (PgdA/CDA1 family)